MPSTVLHRGYVLALTLQCEVLLKLISVVTLQSAGATVGPPVSFPLLE